MRLVIDTNRIIAALVKSGISRYIILDRRFSFLTPEYTLEEFEAHLKEISNKSGLSENEIRIVADILFERIEIVPMYEYSNFIERANSIIGNVDEKDAPFIALTLASHNDGIRSDDKHFQKQNVIKMWTTELIIKEFFSKV